MDTSENKVYQSLNKSVIEAIPHGVRVMLDIGCGGGTHAEYFAASGVIVDGVTISPSEADLAAKVCRQVYIYDLENGLPPENIGPYDLCLCSHVIEHIRDPDLLLKAIWNLIGPQGYALVALPNLFQYKSRLNLLRGKFVYQQYGIMDSTHVRWYTWETGPELFQASGFKVERKIADGGFPLSIFRKVLGRSLSSYVDRTAAKFGPGLFGWQHIYLLKRSTPDESKVSTNYLPTNKSKDN
jgi:SAM-dependent methyltransferase